MADCLRAPSLDLTSAPSGRLELSPPYKRYHLSDSFSSDESSGDVEYGGPGQIFPSDEDDTDCTSERAIYPSEESSDAFSVMTAKNAPAGEVNTITMTDNEDHPELLRIGRLLIGKCCSKLCLRHLTATDIISAKVDYLSQTRSAQRAYLFSKLKENSSESGPRTITTRYFISGKETCETAWAQIYDLSLRTLSRMLKQLADQGDGSHGNLGKRRVNTKAESVSSWMDAYFNLIGDKMPTKDQIHLPSWETQKDIYSRYAEDMNSRGMKEEDIAGISMFYKIWTEQFSNVIIPQENRFAKCDVCVMVKLERKNCLDKQKQEELRKLLDSHLERVKIERKKYHSHREKSRLHPEKYLTVIVDGMDQSKTNLPNTKLIAKSTSSLWRLRTHVTGAILHTKAPHGKLVYCFVDFVQFPHDSNLTLTVIVNVLVDYAKTNRFPEVLYLQMDNTCRENKNRFVLTFCAALVHLQIFKKVQINFLPVGHTHEDIDQVFSRVSDNLRQSGCESIPDLLTKLHESCKPNPTSQLLQGVWDFKAWMDSTQGDMENHAKYHIFRFTKGSSSKVEMHYKHYSTDAWLPEGVGKHLIVTDPDLTEKPPLVEPNGDKLDLPRFYQDLPKYYQYLSEESRQNWEQFHSQNPETICPNDDLQWEMPKLLSAAIVSSQTPVETADAISANTISLIQKETATPKPIKVKHKGKENISSISNVPAQTECNNPDLSLKVGSIVACFLAEYSDEEPQLGKIVNVPNDRSFEVEWMVGAYSEPWRIWRERKGQDYVTWKETIAKESVLFPITLSKSNRIPSNLISQLKVEYTNRRNS